MASPNTIHFTDANFETEAMQAGQPVLVDFWAEWCGPCRAIAPMIDELATNYAGKAKIGKVDIDSNRDLALRFGIQSIPTILLLKDGEVVNKWVGMQPKPVIQKALDAAAG
jgi:thioredoxin 1